MFKRKTILFILLVLAFTLTGCAKCGDDICQRWEERRGSCSADCPAANVETPPSPVTPTPDIEPATPPVSEPTTIKGETISVKSFTTIKRNLKTIDWSHTNDLITFGKVGTDGYYDVHVMESDGSRTKCLTCSEPRVPKHNGNPAWHPSGDYIVFTGENKDNTKENKEWALPGTGFNCNLWVMTSDGEKFYQLTDFPLVTPYQAVIHPHFSHDGKKLFWAQKQDPNQGRLGGWGGWALKVADFVVDSQGASLENITTYKPGEESCFYESHAFSSDDQKILFTGNLQSGHPETGIDVYELHLETEKLTRLTSTLNDWDEHAR